MNQQTNQAQPPVCWCLGSSVTYGEANGGVSFAEYLAQESGWQFRKEAVGGTSLAGGDWESYFPRLKRNVPLETRMDYFICQLSTNDVWQEKAVGAVSQSWDPQTYDLETTVGALELILDYVKTHWGCPMAVYTNPYFESPRYAQLVEHLYQLQEKWGIQIIDFYQYRGMTPLPKEVLRSYMADDIHPLEAGYRWMAKEMLPYLLEKHWS